MKTRTMIILEHEAEVQAVESYCTVRQRLIEARSKPYPHRLFEITGVDGRSITVNPSRVMLVRELGDD